MQRLLALPSYSAEPSFSAHVGIQLHGEMVRHNDLICHCNQGRRLMALPPHSLLHHAPAASPSWFTDCSQCL